MYPSKSITKVLKNGVEPSQNYTPKKKKKKGEEEEEEEEKKKKKNCYNGLSYMQRSVRLRWWTTSPSRRIFRW